MPIAITRFRALLRRGRGEAILALREADDPSVFESEILYALLHDTRWDHQCEEDRAAYLAMLLREYPARDALIEKLCTPVLLPKSSDNRIHYIRSLAALARLGYAAPAQIVLEAYRKQYALLLTRTEIKNGWPKAEAGYVWDPEPESFSEILLAAIYAGVLSCRTALEDLAALRDANPETGCPDDTLATLIDRMRKMHPDIIEILASESACAALSAAYQRTRTRWEAPKHQLPYDIPLETLLRQLQSQIGISLPQRQQLKRFAADPSNHTVLTETAFDAAMPRGVRAYLFSLLPPTCFPLSRLLDAARAEAEVLLMPATEGRYPPLQLINTLHRKLARRYAGESEIHLYREELLARGVDALELASLEVWLLAHDAPQMLIAKIRALPSNNSAAKNALHAYQYNVLELLAEKDTVDPSLTALLPYIYDTTPCANCREYAIRSMMQSGCLPEEIRRAGLYDCQSEIRALCAGEKPHTST